jgi:hypothetical protein
MYAGCDRLKRDGRDTTSATSLLQTLEQSQALHIANRDRLQKQLDEFRSTLR